MPQNTISDGSLAPPLTMQKTHDTKQATHTHKRINNKMTQYRPITTTMSMFNESTRKPPENVANRTKPR